MNTTSAPARLWSRLIPTRRRVVAYAILLVALLAARVGLDLWVGHNLRMTAERLAPAYGGSLSLASLNPPAVPPEENRARIFAAAGALTVPGSAERQAAVADAVDKHLPADPAQRLAPLREAVAANPLALHLLDAAESRPVWNWDIGYSDRDEMRIPSLTEIRNLSRLNVAAGLVSLADGKPDDAARRVRIGLALEESLAPVGVLIVGLVRVAVTGEQYRLLREVLAGGEPSGAALEALAPHLEADATRQQMTTSLVGELKYFNHIMLEVEAGKDTREDASGPIRMRPALVWLLEPGILAVHLQSLGVLDRMVQYARLQPFERAERRLRPPTEEAQSWWRRRASFLFNGLERAVQSGDELRAESVLAATAVALRRYRLDHGGYPSSLDVLAPAYLAVLPPNPFTGRAVDYRNVGAGFELRARGHDFRGPGDRFTWSIPR